MTSEEREQVVELLRCAADIDPDATGYPDDPMGLADAESALDVFDDGLYEIAARPFAVVRDEMHRCGSFDYRLCLLETALRIEIDGGDNHIDTMRGNGH